MPEEQFIQEACLGRVKVKRTKKIAYLVKWENYDRVGDVTCEPANNVLVGRTEEPCLDQASPTFQEDLGNLLKAYLASKGQTVPPPLPATGLKKEKDEKGKKRGPVPKSQAEELESKKQKTGKTPAGLPPTSAPQDDQKPEIIVKDRLYTVETNRQYVVLPQPKADGAWHGLFVTIRTAKRNPGLAWTTASSLSREAWSEGCRLYGSVESASKNGGFGWFHHEKSGLSLDGIRISSKNINPGFGEEDTIGIVVDTASSTGYLVKNGHTVCKVVYHTPKAQMCYALHLCPGDEIEICETQPEDLQKFADESVQQLKTEKDASGAAPTSG